jgi:lysophospholipase L1-like esterase
MGAKSNPEQMVKDYRSMVDTLARDRPGLRLVHSTMPLTSLEQGRKALLKRTLGRPSAAELDNALRGTYNDALRGAFPQSAIFDLAATESHAPGVEPALVTRDGKAWATLANELTTDGGHLNPGGQVLAARELLLALARQT